MTNFSSASGSLIPKLGSVYAFQRSSNPGFLTTVSFRASDGLNMDSRVRITAFDVRERVSQTATPIGSAVMMFSAIQDTPRRDFYFIIFFKYWKNAST